MEKVTEQMKHWMGEFGENYRERNFLDPDGVDQNHINNYGITRTAINQEFFGELSKDIKILEVGCNLGHQLLLLKRMGFQNLCGVEINPNTAAIAQERCESEGIEVKQGSAFEIPYDDKKFDLVFTSGVLIHISPNDIETAIKEISRCSSKYIWGFEYYAEKYEEVNYRGNDDLLWKTNFAELYQKIDSSLRLVKEKHYPYLENDNVDTVYLLEK